MTGRSKVTPVLVSLKGIDPFSTKAVERFEEELVLAEKRGIKVRVLVLSNPHNPLGQCYPRQTLVAFMQLCQKYRLHLLSDEIYALTTFPTRDNAHPLPFHSLLSIDKGGIIDPSLCHIIHGMSKDFCANGFRLSVLISQANPLFHQALRSIEMFSWPSSLAEQAMSTILNHPTFLPKFLQRNRQLLAERYAFVSQFLQVHSIKYVPSNAGFFIWMDLSPYLNHYEGVTPLERERTMNDALFDGGVHLATSEAFEGEDSGWFRLSFAVEQQILELGLERIAKILGLQQSAIELVSLNFSRPKLGAMDIVTRLMEDVSISASRRPVRDDKRRIVPRKPLPLSPLGDRSQKGVFLSRS